MSASLLLGLIGLGLVNAQFPPTPEGVTELKSKFHDNVVISYKEPGICETTPGVKSYAGYIHLPPDALNETHEHNAYPINTFFWFFESRKDPHNAPLSIWLNGGPGGSSLMGALSENGPCFVNSDSNSTYLNPWSWNNEANLLFIDQPVQVGFSYDVLTNITQTLDISHPNVIEGWQTKPADFSGGVPQTNSTFLVGTSGSQKLESTANTTHHAAVAMWHFAQTWFEEFPGYKPDDESISLFTESYGGHYGPAFISYFMHQNERIAKGELSGPGAHYLHLNTLGIVNGCIDEETSAKAYIDFAYNNTYGIKAISHDQYTKFVHNFEKEDGLHDRMRECRRMAKSLDPRDHGEVDRVNKFCRKINEDLEGPVDAYRRSKKYGWYDVTHPLADSFPPVYLVGFLQQGWVQKALGVPVNYTGGSFAVNQAFDTTADMIRGGYLEHIGYILDHGVRVHMMYGDRDYACNWIGGERSSVAVPWAYKEHFSEAGYAPLVLSPVHSGGSTRQYGNLSFTRVYQAGHLVPSYQPEAAYEIFTRAITGRDIATGGVDLAAHADLNGEEYSTTGPADTWWMKSEMLPAPESECYILEPDRCNDKELSMIADGSAIIKDWIFVGVEDEQESEHEPVMPSMENEPESVEHVPFGETGSSMRQQPLVDW